MRKRLLNKAHCGFTMVEVMIASAILALIASLSLGGAWRLAGFARDEAERLAADGYCHDVLWRFFQMDDQALADHGKNVKYTVPKGTLPVLISKKANGTEEVVSPLWRQGYAAPSCTISVVPCEYDTATEKWTELTSFESASNTLITVLFKWGRATGDEEKTNLLQVVRAGHIERWQNVQTGQKVTNGRSQ